MEIEKLLKQVALLVQRFLGLAPQTQAKIVISIMLILAIEILRLFVMRFILRKVESTEQTYRWTRTARYVAFALMFLLVGRVWITGFQSLITYLGILSAGLAIAMQDVLKNLAGWLFILWRRPFILGDRLQTGSHIGDVIDIRIFSFTLLEVGQWVKADQNTGRLIHVPNGRVFTDALTNYFQGFEYIWSELPVLVTFEADWRKAKKILQDLAERHGAHLSATARKKIREASTRYMINYMNLEPTVFTSVEDSGILLTMRYLVEPRRRRTTDQEVWEDMLDEFARHEDIDFAYPTQRYYINSTEGKAGLRPNPVSG